MEAEQIEVKRTYLQMTSPEELQPAQVTDDRVRIEEVHNCPPHFFRYLYSEVGRAYHWIDRLGWTDEEILAYLADANVRLWVMYYAGAPAGYFELKRYEDGSTEIAYFGLMQEYLGRGLGKHLLTETVRRAWEADPTRVWLHTCTLDDPAAMPNYRKRGFQPFKEEIYYVDAE